MTIPPPSNEELGRFAMEATVRFYTEVRLVIDRAIENGMPAHVLRETATAAIENALNPGTTEEPK
jgi:hypothetical protein